MGVYVRKDSAFFWLCLERRGQRALRESARIPIEAATSADRHANRALAEGLYTRRMSELRKTDLETRVVAIDARRVTRSIDGWCFLYCIQREDLVKIGRAVDVPERLRTLQAAHPAPLLLRAAVPCHAALEGAVHRRFAHLRARGEWFYLEPELQAFIQRLTTGENPVALLWEA